MLTDCFTILLGPQHDLIAEILSYIVYDTRDLAELRLISHEWNAKVIPFVLPSCGFIRHCYQHDWFLHMLLDIDKRYKNRIKNDIELRLEAMMRKALQNGEESDDDEEELEIFGLMGFTQDQLLVPEGLAIADGCIPESLHAALMQQIDALADGTDADYHPHSNGIVRDLVHPALYAYVKNVSAKLPCDPIPPAGIGAVASEQASSAPKDYWGRKYESSSKYQWLPTYFEIGADGSCTINDYINNLVPRSQYEPLYTSLAALFSHALPLIESVFSYGRVVRPLIRDNDLDEDEGVWFDEEDLDDSQLFPFEEEYHSLRGQKLQVITKIVDYELNPGQSYEGVWHVEGMSHEEIVATAIYFIHRDDDIEGGDLLFQRAFHMREALFMQKEFGQVFGLVKDMVAAEGLMPLGKVETLPKRFVVFPNSHVHKVTKMENKAASPLTDTNDSDSVQKRRIVVFFLVNPEKRIVSTREIPPQQTEAGGSMSREDAMKHRLELMKERKYQKQDWNVRKIELCEH